MAYVIHDGDNYVRQENGYYSIVRGINKATTWPTASKAKNVCDNVKNQRIMKKYNLSVICAVKDSTKTKTIPIKDVKEMEFCIEDKVNELSELSKQLELRRSYLQDKIQESDLAISDIEHAAELYKLNASQGYKIYKELHTERNKRRKYKDELEKINLCISAGISCSQLETVQKSLTGMSKRKYTPRVKKELFKEINEVKKIK